MVNNTNIALLKRETLTLTTWEWHVDVQSPSDPAADTALLALLAARVSFNAGNRQDACNQFFAYVTYMLIAVAVVVGFGILYCLYRKSMQLSLTFI